MKSSDLRRINLIFEPFGRLDDGRLRIRWFDTFATELRYFIEKDGIVKKHPTAPLFIVEADWKMYYWGERIGKGWVVAVWKPPIPRDQFILRYGTTAPYPSKGEYQIIENTKRDENDPPNERNTALIKQLLQDMFYRGANHMAPAGTVATSNEILASLVSQQERKHEATRKQIEDEIDDLLPAFGKKPGSRGGGVSIGGI